MAHHLTSGIDFWNANRSSLYSYHTQKTELISSRDRNTFELVNYVIISSTLALFGLLTNTMNIIVFYKQGFNSTVNISFFAVSISDTCNLVFVIWFSIGMNPLFAYSDIDIWPAEILYLTSGIPRICFSRITGWITVFITAERCLCIILPLKVKQIVTPTRTSIIIIIIFVVVIITVVPEYAVSYHCWKFYERRNRTLLGLCFTNDDTLNGVVFFLYSTLGSASFVSVIIFTSILTIVLNQKSKWRMQATNDQERCKSTSNRELKAIRMVIMLATVLIVCYTPGVVASMLMYLLQDFKIFGAYANTTYVMWSFVFVLETLNSSINIFFYYNMSVKYRETFCLLSPCWFQAPSDSEQRKGQR